MPDPEVLIRTARVDDAPAIGELITRLGYATSSVQMAARLRTLLAHPDYRGVVGEVGGAVVGVAGGVVEHCFEMDGRAARLLILSVAPSYQKRGIGHLLVREIENWARDCGATEIVVHSGLHRTDAHRFYERVGYGGMGRRFVKRLA